LPFHPKDATLAAISPAEPGSIRHRRCSSELSGIDRVMAAKVGSMNSERKTLIKIALFIFASALVGGYLKERARWKHNLYSPRPDPGDVAYNVVEGALEYFRQPLGLLAVFLFVCLFLKARDRSGR
jgi:hypothetical protein